jgi:hypothetical protein
MLQHIIMITSIANGILSMFLILLTALVCQSQDGIMIPI